MALDASDPAPGPRARPGAYLDEFVGHLSCAPELLTLKLFPNAKELTESMGVYHAARNAGFPLLDGESGVPEHADDVIVVVGDGMTPRTAALFAFRARGWRCVSVDPLAKAGPWDGGAIQGLSWAAARIQDVRVTARRAIVVLVHAHVTLDDAMAAVDAQEVVGVVTLLCCNYGQAQETFRGHPPSSVFRDPHIASPENEVRVWGPEVCARPPVDVSQEQEEAEEAQPEAAEDTDYRHGHPGTAELGLSDPRFLELPGAGHSRVMIVGAGSGEQALAAVQAHVAHATYVPAGQPGAADVVYDFGWFDARVKAGAPLADAVAGLRALMDPAGRQRAFVVSTLPKLARTGALRDLPRLKASALKHSAAHVYLLKAVGPRTRNPKMTQRDASHLLEAGAALAADESLPLRTAADMRAEAQALAPDETAAAQARLRVTFARKLMRKASLFFFMVDDETSALQVIADARNDVDVPSLGPLRRGDQLELVGRAGKSRKGIPSLVVDGVRLVAVRAKVARVSI